MHLRPFIAQNAATVVQWIGDKRTLRMWSADKYADFPITADDVNKFYSAQNPRLFFPFTAIEDGEITGHLIMRFCDRNQSLIRFGFIIVDDKKRGKGYGREMLTQAIGLAFRKYRAEKIEIGVFEDNTAARRLYASLGFSQVPDKEETYVIDGEVRRCLILEKSKAVCGGTQPTA